jgi:hypothetical protein
VPLEDFERFREVVMSEPELRDELRGIENRESLWTRTIALGKARGFEFGEADMEQVAQNIRVAWLERWLYQ